MFPSSLPIARSKALECAAVALSLAAAAPALAQEGALSQLYAPRPPAGASYVRVVNPLPVALAIRVAKGPVQQLGGKAPAGSYAIVPGGQRFGVQIDGKEVARLEVRPDSFSTLALRREAASYALTVIDDTADTEDALKAELRFYNLAAGCSAANLLLAPAGTAAGTAAGMGGGLGSLFGGAVGQPGQRLACRAMWRCQNRAAIAPAPGARRSSELVFDGICRCPAAGDSA